MSKNSQIEACSKIEYFCLTTDLWSSRRRAFLGVTIHWICPETYQRKHNALACRRIKGKHSAFVLASNIDDVIRSFKISIRKILKIITDGARNFKKAFTEHKFEEDEDEELSEEDMFLFLSESDSPDGQIFLPPHKRCGSHSMCLILTSDVKIKKPRKCKKKVTRLSESDKKFNIFRQSILDPTLKKCQDLFNKQQNSTKAADLVKSYLNRYLVTPTPTRWNGH